MKLEQYIITDRVKLNLLPSTYTFEIDGKIYDADWEEPYTDRDEMIEVALEQIAIEVVEHWNEGNWEQEHEEFLTHLHKLHNLLLPNSPI